MVQTSSRNNQNVAFMALLKTYKDTSWELPSLFRAPKAFVQLPQHFCGRSMAPGCYHRSTSRRREPLCYLLDKCRESYFSAISDGQFSIFHSQKGNSLELPFKVMGSFVKPCERVLGSVIPLIWCYFWGQWSSYWPSGQGVEILQLTPAKSPREILVLGLL